MRYIQVYYFIAVSVRDLFTRTNCIAVYVSSVCTGSLFLLQCLSVPIYRAIIVLHCISLRNVQGHYCTAACVNADFTI